VEIPRGILGRWKLLKEVADYDVVLLQKRLLPRWQFKALRRRARAIVYDFDDPMIYHRLGGQVAFSQTRAARFRTTLQGSDATICHFGFESLAREYGATNITTIPTSVDLSRWPAKTSWDMRDLILGWLGTASNLPNLREIAPALAGHRLRLVADQTLDLPGVEVEFLKWDAATEAAHVRSFDVALAPLSDDPWSRTKMPFKILNYFAAAVPVIATDIGVVNGVIRDGENGLLAGDWKEKIERLRDPALRERLGRAGRKTVETSFTIDAAYAKLKSVLESVR